MRTYFIPSPCNKLLKLPPRSQHLRNAVRRMVLIATAAAFQLGQAGCARHVTPTVVPEEIRAHPGVVALVVPKAPPHIDVGPRIVGKVGGAAQGAGGATAGLWAGCLELAGHDGAGGAIIILFFCVPATPFVATGGAVVGAITHERKDVPAAQAQARVQEALDELKFQATLRDHVLELARSRTPHIFVVRAEFDPLTLSDRPDFRMLAEANVDTVLEVRLTDIRMIRTVGEGKPLAFVMEARASLDNTRSGEELYAQKFKFQSEGREFPQWAENDGAALGQALEQGYKNLAESIVKDVFLH